MKLNDDQRKVMQALLDGKNVSFSFGTEPFQQLTLGSGCALIAIGVSNDVKYKIEEPAVKVALFDTGDGGLTSFTESEYLDYGYEDSDRVSDWVEITSTKGLS